MGLSRRAFLRMGALTAAAGATAGCGVVGREMVQAELPEELAVPETTAEISEVPDKVTRLLNRAGYGGRPGDWERVNAIGYEAYVEQQLAFELVDDTELELQVNSFNINVMDISQLINRDRPENMRELIWANILRKTYSERQLYEVMVEFWSDHFHIYSNKSMYMPALLAIHEREVIRPQALGNFKELLRATVYSPAMLHYLDNDRNLAEAPNENYARELLELHTLGVYGGYTQQDVAEASRVLSGLGIGRRGQRQGQMVFRPEVHDDGEKVVLGQTFPAGQGEQDIEQLIDLVALHPATAEFVATKLVRRLVADEPPADLVAEVAQVFLETDGDIKSMVRLILLSDAFATAPLKLKRPYHYFISVLRRLHVNVRNGRPLVEWLRQLGQVPYGWPSPDGFPDVSAAWTQTLLARWNFALNVTGGQIRGLRAPLEDIAVAGGARDAASALDIFAGVLLGRGLAIGEKELFSEYVGTGRLNEGETRRRVAESVALMLASPSFQWV